MKICGPGCLRGTSVAILPNVQIQQSVPYQIAPSSKGLFHVGFESGIFQLPVTILTSARDARDLDVRSERKCKV